MASNGPSWLDTYFMQKVLQNFENDEYIEVSHVIVEPAIPKGENYLSDLYRVNVEFSRGQKGQEITTKTSLILKIAPTGDFREAMISDAEFFKTEMLVVSQTLPSMNKILDKIGVTSLAGRCFHVQYQAPIHLIIEDLTTKGFQVADRQAGLDLDHCLISLRKLAAFHASSVALREEDPNALTQHSRGMLHKDHPLSLATFFNESTKALGEEVAKWLELSPRISKKILELSEVFYKKGCESALFREDDFNVLNHGDCWVNNMMFLCDERQKPIDVMFVDFQMCCHGSPALDLLYFLGTSPRDDIRAHKRELLLREYHTSLTDTMTKLKCNTEAPSFEKLQGMLRDRAFYEVVACFVLLPLVLVDKNEYKTLDEIMSPDGTYENPGYQNKIYRQVMTRVLPLYDSMGLLDS